MMTEATGVMPREAVQGEEKAHAKTWEISTFKVMRRKRVSDGDREGAAGEWGQPGEQ